MQIGMAFVNYYVKIYIGLAALGTFFNLAQVEIAQMQIRPKHLVQPPMHITFEYTSSQSMTILKTFH